MSTFVATQKRTIEEAEEKIDELKICLADMTRAYACLLRACEFVIEHEEFARTHDEDQIPSRTLSFVENAIGVAEQYCEHAAAARFRGAWYFCAECYSFVNPESAVPCCRNPRLEKIG